MDKTDAKLKTLERQIKSVYTKAYQEMKKEASDILAKIEVNPDMPLAQKMALMTKYDRLNTLSTQLANTAYEANSYAQKMINNEMVNIYDINYNGDAERLGFGLVDHTAIKKVLKQEENPFNMISSLRDKEGIRNQMKGQLLSGLLKGEGINKIARRLKDVSEKSLKDSIRIARTETTRVQNSAKMDIGKHGQELGFEMWKRWVATTDGRVREDHLAMNGVEVPQDEPFVLPDGSKMMFPADVSMGADVSQVVNCRCTMIEFIKENNKVDDDNDIKDIPIDELNKRYEKIEVKPESVTKGYTGTESAMIINDLLRNKENYRNYSDVIERLDENMQKAKEQIDVQRGISINGFINILGISQEQSRSMSFNDLIDMATGKTFIDYGFVSTSQKTSLDLSRNQYGQVIMNMHLMKGTELIRTSNIEDGLQEIILGRGQEYKINSVSNVNGRILLDIIVRGKK